jgi:hypothetical protein
MSLSSDLRNYLVSQATITAYTSTGRIYPVRLPLKLRTETSLPALTYWRRSGGHNHDLGGSAGTAMPAVQIDCWAASYETADKLAEAVRLKLQGFAGTMGSTSTTTIQAITLDDEKDDFEPYDDGSDDGIFVRSQIYSIRYVETIPSL